MGKSPAHWAVIRNSKELLRLLMDLNSDVSLPDFTGKTPLSYAILDENESLIKVIPDNILDVVRSSSSSMERPKY